MWCLWGQWKIVFSSPLQTKNNHSFTCTEVIGFVGWWIGKTVVFQVSVKTLKAANMFLICIEAQLTLSMPFKLKEYWTALSWVSLTHFLPGLFWTLSLTRLEVIISYLSFSVYFLGMFSCWSLYWKIDAMINRVDMFTAPRWLSPETDRNTNQALSPYAEASTMIKTLPALMGTPGRYTESQTWLAFQGEITRESDICETWRTSGSHPDWKSQVLNRELVGLGI